MAINSCGAFFKWQNISASNDFLQLSGPNGTILGGINSSGQPFGSLSTASVISFAGVPTGPCLGTQIAVNSGTGDLYSCSNGVWVKVGPTAGSLVSPITSPNPLAFDVNVAFKGPNPYVDATRFGVRAVVASAVPAVPGITVNCTSGSPNVTISSASTFQNGDGVALYGCGPGTIGVPAAPTVTPSLAAAQTGLLLDVNGLVGSTTYCYQLVARTLMGATNVSPETCTTTGPASLGLQTNSIISASLSNTTATYTTSAAHGLVVGAHVVVTGMAVNVPNGQAGGQANLIPFNGWFTVATVPDNTHFTINLLSDSRNGTITAGTGGTVSYWNSIHISATETTGNFQYYVYGRVSGGTKTLIGTMWPQDSGGGFGGDPTYLAFQDFGSPVTTFPNPPSYIPTTVPTTPTHDMLATTIVSGAGTTSLVLANNAGNTISGQTIVFDDAITFLAAATYAANVSGGTNGPLMIPEPGNNSLSYVFNSPISLGTGATSRITILQKGTVTINEPISLTFVSWYGQPTSNMPIASFAPQGGSAININKASPGIYALNNTYLFDLVLSMLSTNGSTAYIQEAGGIPTAGTFRNMSLGFSTVTEYSNMGMVFRGGAGFNFTNLTLIASQNGNLISNTPGIYFNLATNSRFDNLTLSGVGIATRVNDAGGFMEVDNVYSQGNYEPYFSFINSGGSLFELDIRQVLFDTTNLPLIANYGGAVLNAHVTNPNAPSNDTIVTGSFPPGGSARTSLTLVGTSTSGGTPQNLSMAQLNQIYSVNDGTLGQTQTGIDIFNRSITIGPAYSLFTTTGFYPSPTCLVSAGGSIPVGALSYWFAPIFANGSEGTISTICSATTSSGNQTVTLNWAVVPGVTQYRVFRNGISLTGTPITGNTYVDTLAAPGGNPGSGLASGGPSGMRGNLIWSQQFQTGDRAVTQSGAGAPSAGLCTTSKGGSLYLRTDGTTTTTLYVCDGSTGTWTAK